MGEQHRGQLRAEDHQSGGDGHQDDTRQSQASGQVRGDLGEIVVGHRPAHHGQHAGDDRHRDHGIGQLEQRVGVGVDADHTGTRLRGEIGDHHEHRLGGDHRQHRPSGHHADPADADPARVGTQPDPEPGPPTGQDEDERLRGHPGAGADREQQHLRLRQRFQPARSTDHQEDQRDGDDDEIVGHRRPHGGDEPVAGVQDRRQGRAHPVEQDLWQEEPEEDDCGVALFGAEPRGVEIHEKRSSDDRHHHHGRESVDDQGQQPLGEQFAVGVPGGGRTDQQRNDHTCQRPAHHQLIDRVRGDVRHRVGVHQPRSQAQRGHQRQHTAEARQPGHQGRHHHGPACSHEPWLLRHTVRPLRSGPSGRDGSVWPCALSRSRARIAGPDPFRPALPAWHVRGCAGRVRWVRPGEGAPQNARRPPGSPRPGCFPRAPRRCRGRWPGRVPCLPGHGCGRCPAG